jgi:hypothetical protein
MICRMYGYNATVETAGGRDYGVYPENYAQDMAQAGYETRLGYLPFSPRPRRRSPAPSAAPACTRSPSWSTRSFPPAGDPMALTGR